MIQMKYCHDADEQMNLRGFIDYFTDLIKDRGEKVAWAALKNWGYDEDLYPTQSRTFILTIHSMIPLKMQIDDTTKSATSGKHVAELEETVNRLIIQKFGSVAEEKLGFYSLQMKQHE